jgi:hypothetical protein
MYSYTEILTLLLCSGAVVSDYVVLLLTNGKMQGTLASYAEWGGGILDKPRLDQFVRYSLHSLELRRSVTLFTKARHCVLAWGRRLQFFQPYYNTISHLHLCLSISSAGRALRLQCWMSFPISPLRVRLHASLFYRWFDNAWWRGQVWVSLVSFFCVLVLSLFCVKILYSELWFKRLGDWPNFTLTNNS